MNPLEEPLLLSEQGNMFTQEEIFFKLKALRQKISDYPLVANDGRTEQRDFQQDLETQQRDVQWDLESMRPYIGAGQGIISKQTWSHLIHDEADALLKSTTSFEAAQRDHLGNPGCQGNVNAEGPEYQLTRSIRNSLSQRPALKRLEKWSQSINQDLSDIKALVEGFESIHATNPDRPQVYIYQKSCCFLGCFQGAKSGGQAACAAAARRLNTSMMSTFWGCSPNPEAQNQAPFLAAGALVPARKAQAEPQQRS